LATAFLTLAGIYPVFDMATSFAIWDAYMIAYKNAALDEFAALVNEAFEDWL
jgi:hypothetical protein